MVECQLCARSWGPKGRPCPPGAHSVAKVKGCRPEHKSTAIQDGREPGPSGLMGVRSPGKGREVDQCDGSRYTGLRLRAVRAEQERRCIVARLEWKAAELGVFLMFSWERLGVFLGQGGRAGTFSEWSLCAKYCLSYFLHGAVIITM